MASINVNITLDNGSNFSGAATMEDNETLTGIARTLAEIIRDSALPAGLPAVDNPGA